MTNQEKAATFLDMAERVYRETTQALEEKAWNLALRRAQEVIELVLKGLILLMGADYPKVHDPAEGFAQLVQERGLEIPDETVAEIQALSSDLADKRAPAFYGEIEISEEEARVAAEGAAMVLQLGLKLRRELESGTTELEQEKPR